ncbi:MAG: ATP-binding protein [Chlorobiaceae bacterium]|nr:ATP-binding protein [Chlorobiaceae bacterium]
MKKVITLTLPGELIFTRLAAQTAASVAALVCGECHPKDNNCEFINAFELAVSEAFTNSALHACQDELPPVTLTFIAERHQLTVTVRDTNEPFGIETPQPDIESYPEGGYGLLIIRKVMDTVTYRRDGDANIISMSKKL